MDRQTSDQQTQGGVSFFSLEQNARVIARKKSNDYSPQQGDSKRTVQNSKVGWVSEPTSYPLRHGSPA
jgi:hypothetical protein